MANDNRVDVEFGAKTGELDDAFSKVKEGAKSIGDQIKDGFDPATAASTALGFSIANLASDIASQLSAAVREAIFAFSELGGEIEHMQHRLGGSSEGLSELKVALDSVGISTSTYEAIANRLPMVIEKNAEKFRAAGIAYTDAHNNLLPVSQIITNITAHLEKFSAGQSRNTEGARLMGNAFRMMADMGELTTEKIDEAEKVARQFGLTLSEDDVQAADDFGRQTSLLQTAIHGFYVEVGSALTPALTQLAVIMRETLAPAFDLFAFVLKPLAILLDGVVMSIVLVVAAFLSLVASLELVIKLVNAAGWVLAGQFTKGMDLAKDAVENYKKEVQSLGDVTMKAADALNKHMGRIVFGEKPASEEGGSTPPPDRPKVSLDRTSLIKAQQDSDLALQKEYLREAQAIYDEAYKHDLITLKEYYTAKLVIAQSGIDATIAAKKKERAALEEKQAEATASAAKVEKSDPEAAMKFQQQALDLAAQEKRITGDINLLKAQRLDLERSIPAAEQDAANARIAAMEKVSAQEALMVSQSGIEKDRTEAQQQLALRQITNERMFALQKNLEDREFAARQEFLRKKREADLMDGKDIEQKETAYRIAKEQSELQHQQKLTEIKNAAARENAKYSLQAQQAMQDSMGTMFEDLIKGTKSLSDAFKSFADSVIASIIRIQAQKMAEGILGMSMGGGTVGSVFGGLFGGSFAVGTNYVPNDMLAMVHKGERIVPASQNNPAMLGAGAGGGMNVTNNFHVSGPVDNRTQGQIATLAGLSLQRAMERNA